MAVQSDSATDVYINNKPTYHTDEHSAYALPNDAPEHVRLETQAKHLAAIMNNQIVHCPISPPIQGARMLDVGCGTGIVTDELGSRFPQAQIYGLDLSAVPQLRPRPRNVSFLQGNILQDKPSKWFSPQTSSGGSPFPSGQETGLFDLIFSRLLVCGMNDWPGYVSKLHLLLKPGGFAELHDNDFVWYRTDPNTGATTTISDSWRWLQLINQATQAKSMDLQPGHKLATRMKEAGFEDIQVTEYRWPHGGQWEEEQVWKDWGDFVAEEMVGLCWHMIPRLLPDYSDGDIQELREEMKKCLAPEEGKHWIMRVVFGRKSELSK